MSNEEQKEYWNGEAGERWAKDDQMMENLLRPITQALLAHANPLGCRSAIDVGCGGGSQSIMLAEHLGPTARVLGVDISAPMLGVARQKLSQQRPEAAALEFLQADASGHEFEPASFDLLFSRFGVMFFDDPVAAFTNLATALQPGARLAFSCWQPLQKNDWTWLPLQAALKHLPPPPPPEPNAPGPFAFADPVRVNEILTASGFTGIELTPHKVSLSFGEAPSLEENVRELARVGPIGRLLADQPESALAPVFAAMEEALAPHFQDQALVLPGAVWFATASREA